MSKWLRWYDGTCEDAKFRFIARNASVTVRDVISLWALLLENASCNAHRGVCRRSAAFLSSILDLDVTVTETILIEMGKLDLIIAGNDQFIVQNWGKRQFETDKSDGTNAERQKRWRNANKTKDKRKRNGTVTVSVTATKRPDTDTDTDTDTERKILSEPPKRRSVVRDPDFGEWYKIYPRHEAPGSAEKAYLAARKLADHQTLMAGAIRAKARYTDPKYTPLAATWLNRRQWEDEAPPAPKPGGGFA